MSYTRLVMETDMSLHNKPLTDLEKTGLIKHGLPTDKHSQLSDAFRLGMEWALKEERKAANMNNDKTVSGATSHLTQELGFDDVILWHGAFSYYCGRATIVVSAFIDDLIKNWPHLSPKLRYLIERDLERAFLEDDDLRANGASYKRLGHDCDRKEWEKVRRLWTDKKT